MTRFLVTLTDFHPLDGSSNKPNTHSSVLVSAFLISRAMGLVINDRIFRLLNTSSICQATIPKYHH